MRKTKMKTALLAAGLACVLMLSACTEADLRKAEAQYSPNYTLCSIETSQSIHSSYLYFYDSELNLVNSIQLPYAQLDGGWRSPMTYADGKVFLIPRGLMAQEDDKLVISLDLANGKIREYAVDQVSLDHVTTDGTYAYVSNDLNGTGHITRIDIETGATMSIDLGAAGGNLAVVGDTLLAFWFDPKAGQDIDYLSCLNQNLEIQHTINLDTETDVGVPTMCVTSPDDDLLYFISMKHAKTDTGRPLASIFTYSATTHEVRFFADARSDPASMLRYKDKLILLNALQDDGDFGYIDVYDIATGELTSEIYLNYLPSQGTISGDTLYFNGGNFSGTSYLAAYTITDTELVEKKRITLGAEDRPPNGFIHYYGGGMFVNEQSDGRK